MKRKTKDTVICIVLVALFLFAVLLLTYTINHINDVNNQNDLLTNELKVAQNKIGYTEEKLLTADIMISELKDPEYQIMYLGEFKITHYCTELWNHICGTGTGKTATGTDVTAGRTIAVDPNVIPYGMNIYIEGYGWRIAEDCGGAVNGRHIDMAVDSHEKALLLGTKYSDVWLLVETIQN